MKFSRILNINVIILVFYFISGLVSFLFKLNGMYATPLWFPPGIALFAYCFCGYAIMPGVFLGSWLLNIYSSYMLYGELNSSVIIVALEISLFATLQTMLGGFVCKLRKNPIPRFENEILQRLCIDIPIPLFIAAFGAPLILMLNNLISKEYYFNSFLTWWLGDYLGVIILLPFAIILQEYMDKRILEKKIFNVLLPTVTLILAISGIFNFASSQLHDQFEETVLWLIYLFSIAFSILFEIFLFFIFLRDRRLNEVLKSQEDKLNLLHQSMFQSEKIKSMGEMAAEISHEIFNPLTIILGRTEVVLRKIKDENMKSDIFGEYAQIVEKNSQRILAIIKGLLALSRDSRDEKFNMLSIKDILEETLDLCSEKIRTSGIQIQSETPKSDIIIESKHYQLCQVFINLLSNAIDAIKNNEVKWIKIDICLSKDAKNVNITFTDSGLGIQPHILEKLMTPFFTTKPLGQGTGLGLSISKDIIQQHKGKLYYNKESVNTQFVIELPVAQQQPNLVHSA